VGAKGDRPGAAGERVAARFLKRRGFRILRRNYVCPAGEADLIALDGRQVVFVEVKSRRSDLVAPPESSVTAAKQARLGRVALDFIRRHRLEEAPCRFDVVSILLPRDGKPHVTHFPDAFPFRRCGH